MTFTRKDSKWGLNRRRKRCLPMVFCMICFAMLIGWVLKDIFQDHPVLGDTVLGDDANDTTDQVVEFGQEVQGKSIEVASAKDQQCRPTGDCEIVCKGMEVDAIEAEITQLVQDLSCPDITLTIDSLVVEDRKLYPKWLDLAETIKINQLKLQNSDIVEIPPGSFDAKCLHGMSILTLDSLQINHLQSNVFIGLQLLQELNLKSLPLKTVESFVLAPVMFTLTRLLVETSLNLTNPSNFTGSSTMDNLAIVSFELNILDDVLDADSFSKLPRLSSLYLRRSHINTLRKGMVDKISRSVQQIHLNGNNLSTIEEGVLDSLIEREVKINLKDNPWNCDCGLEYLQGLVQTYPGMFDGDKMTCKEPEDFAGQLITDVDLGCRPWTDTPPTETTTKETTLDPETTETTDTTTDEVTDTTPTTVTTDSTTKFTIRPTETPIIPTDWTPTSPSASTTTESTTSTTQAASASSTTESTTSTTELTTSTTTTTSTSTTTESTTTEHTSTTTIGNLYTMACIQTAVPLAETNLSTHVYLGPELSLRKRSKTFTVFEAQEGSVEVILDQTYFYAAILWFYDPASSNSIFTLNIEDRAGCADIYGRTIRITNLIPDKNYIFCVVYRSESTVSPFDCLPHKLLPSYGQRTWLIEDQKITVISILIASILVAIMSGVVVTYCFIKSFATYQKTCRKITDLRIERSTTNQCYMTPVADQPKERPRHKRTASDTSLESCRSYVSAIVPATQFQYISWKMDNRRDTGRQPTAPPPPLPPAPAMNFYPKDPPPPPLPPHPSKRLKKQKSEIKINFHEIYDEPTSSNYASSLSRKCQPGKY